MNWINRNPPAPYPRPASPPRLPPASPELRIAFNRWCLETRLPEHERDAAWKGWLGHATLTKGKP